MATFPNGYLSGFNGKLGGAVGFSWKGIPCGRAHVIPSNPNTVAQQGQRNRMSAMIAYAKTVSSTLVANYWNPFAVKMSGFNYLVQQNVMALAATTFYWTVNNFVALGSLMSNSIAGAVLAAGSVTVTWTESTQGNALSTDTVDLFVINKETGQIYSNTDTLTRDDETGAVTCTGETDASKLIAFLVCKRGTGSSYTQSNSSAFQATA